MKCTPYSWNCFTKVKRTDSEIYKMNAYNNTYDNKNNC